MFFLIQYKKMMLAQMQSPALSFACLVCKQKILDAN